jgi:hypothetical protein
MAGEGIKCHLPTPVFPCPGTSGKPIRRVTTSPNSLTKCIIMPITKSFSYFDPHPSKDIWILLLARWISLII